MTSTEDLSLPVIEFALHIGLAIVFVLVGAWCARFTRRRLRLAAARTTLSPSIISLVVSLAYYGVWALTAVAILIALGFPVTTIIAVVGIIVIILGIALQESLKDFAAAVNFRLFRPFESGDYIEVGTLSGTVQEVLPFNTTILTDDNKMVSLTNSSLQSSGFTNYSSKHFLRPQVQFRVNYSADLDQVSAIVEETALAHPNVLPEPTPMVLVRMLDDTSIQVGVRVTVTLADYWTTQSDLRQQIKARLDAAGIVMQAPQLVMRDAAEPHAPPPDIAAEAK